LLVYRELCGQLPILSQPRGLVNPLLTWVGYWRMDFNKKWFSKKWQWALGIVLFLFIFEMSSRFLGAKPHIPLFNSEGPFMVHPTRHWAYQPNFHRSWGGLPFSTNSLGLRDKELSAPKPNSEYRILVLGGSVSAGSFIKDESNIYLNIVEKTFHLDTAQVEIINAGVPGYSTTQQLSQLREIGKRVQPDMILLDFAINDVLDSRMDLKEYNIEPIFRMSNAFLHLTETKTRLAGLKRFILDLPRYTASYSALLGLNKSIKKVFPGDRPVDLPRWIEQELLNETPSPLVKKSWIAAKKQILELNEFAREKKIPFVIVMFPLREQVETRQGKARPQNIINQLSKFNKFHFIDLLASFRFQYQTNSNKHLYFDADHPTPSGHLLAANEIHSRLKPLIKFKEPTSL